LTPLSETFRTLDDLVRAGKVRYIGVSNFTGSQLQEAIDLVNNKTWEPIVCLQPLYNLLERSLEWDLVGVCQKNGVGIIPWSPLAGGWLSGKFNRDTKGPNEGSRVEWAEKLGWKPTGFSSKAGSERTWLILDTLSKISKETGKSVAQISLKWLMQKPGVTAPIIGAKTLDQLKDNLGVIGWTLTPEQMKELDKASEVEIPYPWNHYS
jgi:aryl-alcohol dehydrogenase-like predicted oxidoreductase